MSKGTEFLTTEEVSAFLGVSPRTMERFRLEGRGPKYVKFGRLVRYRIDLLNEWTEQQIHDSCADLTSSEANYQP